MDSERVIFVAGITVVAAVVGTFILWGPSTGTRPKRRGAVVGLQNLGLTCYLNSLLQAMASCHSFVNWLNHRENQGEVTTAMKSLIDILSGRVQPRSEEDYYVSPIDVITALHNSGWKITNSQQDVHELLCNLITILEEEAFKSCVDLSISVDAVTRNSYELINGSRSQTLATNCDLKNNSYNRGTVIDGFRSGISRKCDDCNDDADDNEDRQVNFITSHGDLNFENELKNLPNGGGDVSSRGDGHQNCQNHLFLNTNKKYMSNNRNAMKTDGVFRKLRCAHDLDQNPKPSPFRGYLTNKIECTRCSYKSVLRYDKFDSISLHLPDQAAQNILTLNELLNNFVRNELISGITCEGCNKNRPPDTDLIQAPAIKLSRFGKLPVCLCMHIVRTSFYEYGVYKRQDYVEFPEYIAMDPYLQKITKQSVIEESIIDEEKQLEVDTNGCNASNVQDLDTTSKHIYRLKAVIVHRGSHNDGHFMTYRRGTVAWEPNHGSNDLRWYLVSDSEVKETSLYNVLASIAYVLFYEKCLEPVQLL